MTSPFRKPNNIKRITAKCYYCDSIYYLPFDIIGNALIIHYEVEHSDKVNKEP